MLMVGAAGCVRDAGPLEVVVAWEAVNDPALVGSDAEEVLDVALVEGRLVAVGATAGAPTGVPPVVIGRPAVWLSEDGGASWRRVADDRITPTPPVLAQHERAAMTSVVALERDGDWRLVAAGPATRIKDLLVWISDDLGESWQLAPDQRALVGETLGTMSVTDRVVALGPGLGRLRGDFDRHFEVEVRLSRDGRRWLRLPQPLPVAGGSGANLKGVASHGGRFVAIGSAHDQEGPVLVWNSDDGWSWHQVPPERHGIPAGVELDAVAASPAGLVAAGRGGSGTTVWESDDGVRWEETAALPSNPLRILSLAAHDDGRIAAIARMRTGRESTRNLFLVRGHDGEWEWTQASDEPLHVTAVVAVPDGFLAVGAVRADDLSEAAAWTYTGHTDLQEPHP